MSRQGSSPCSTVGRLRSRPRSGRETRARALPVRPQPVLTSAAEHQRWGSRLDAAGLLGNLRAKAHTSPGPPNRQTLSPHPQAYGRDGESAVDNISSGVKALGFTVLAARSSCPRTSASPA